jgi:hypothetical protein
MSATAHLGSAMMIAQSARSPIKLDSGPLVFADTPINETLVREPAGGDSAALLRDRRS